MLKPAFLLWILAVSTVSASLLKSISPSLESVSSRDRMLLKLLLRHCQLDRDHSFKLTSEEKQICLFSLYTDTFKAKTISMCKKASRALLKNMLFLNIQVCQKNVLTFLINTSKVLALGTVLGGTCKATLIKRKK